MTLQLDDYSTKIEQYLKDWNTGKLSTKQAGELISQIGKDQQTIEKNEHHYCWVCKKEEDCTEEKCDYRVQFQVHGSCMAQVLMHEKNFNDLIVQNRRLIQQMEDLIASTNR